MSKKSATVFVCQECGAQSPKWLGRCGDCGAWNSLVEERAQTEVAGAGASGPHRYAMAGTAGAAQLYADIAIEKKRMLATIKVMQGVSSEELTEVGLFADHVLTRGDQDSTRTKHAIYLGTRKLEIAGVMEDSPRKDNIERAIGKRQTFGKFLDHADRQRGFRRERTDRAGADNSAGIRFQ